MQKSSLKSTSFDDKKPLICAVFALFSKYLSACGICNILITK